MASQSPQLGLTPSHLAFFLRHGVQVLQVFAPPRRGFLPAREVLGAGIVRFVGLEPAVGVNQWNWGPSGGVKVRWEFNVLHREARSAVTVGEQDGASLPSGSKVNPVRIKPRKVDQGGAS